LLEKRPRSPGRHDDVEVFLLRGCQGVPTTLFVITIGLRYMEPLIRKEAATLVVEAELAQPHRLRLEPLERPAADAPESHM
jgi:hypothetical protein